MLTTTVRRIVVLGLEPFTRNPPVPWYVDHGVVASGHAPHTIPPDQQPPFRITTGYGVVLAQTCPEWSTQPPVGRVVVVVEVEDVLVDVVVDDDDGTDDVEELEDELVDDG